VLPSELTPRAELTFAGEPCTLVRVLQELTQEGREALHVAGRKQATGGLPLQEPTRTAHVGGDEARPGGPCLEATETERLVPTRQHRDIGCCQDVGDPVGFHPVDDPQAISGRASELTEALSVARLGLGPDQREKGLRM
jgi:hypothetical protein